MAEIVRETINTQEGHADVVLPVAKEEGASSYQTVEYLIYFFFGILEVLLVFRLILKFMGANTSSLFVSFIYGLTGIFILPFEGIFRRVVAQGVETKSVLEPSTFVAIIVYGILAWGIVKLIQIFSGKQKN